LERVVDRKALGRWWFVAAALGIAGSVLLVATSDEHPVASQTATMIGVLLGLVAGASYATYSWAAQRLMTQGLGRARSEEHTSELQSRFDLVCRLLLEKKKATQ